MHPNRDFIVQFLFLPLLLSDDSLTSQHMAPRLNKAPGCLFYGGAFLSAFSGWETERQREKEPGEEKKKSI